MFLFLFFKHNFSISLFDEEQYRLKAYISLSYFHLNQNNPLNSTILTTIATLSTSTLSCLILFLSPTKRKKFNILTIKSLKAGTANATFRLSPNPSYIWKVIVRVY